MPVRRRVLALIATLAALAGCGPTIAPPPASSPTGVASILPLRPSPGGPFDDVGPTPVYSGPTPSLIACDQATPLPDGSILPAFTPDYPCQLEDTSIQAACEVTGATPPQRCGQYEEARETAIADGPETRIIQRVYNFSAGCFHGISSTASSLKACNKDTGAVTTLAEDLLGDPVASPDGAWLAFVAAEPGSYRMRPHLYRVRADGSGLQQLDTGMFPYRVVGITLQGWSEDGQWVLVSLWDGSEGGHHPVRIQADGSGEHEAAP